MDLNIAINILQQRQGRGLNQAEVQALLTVERALAHSAQNRPLFDKAVAEQPIPTRISPMISNDTLLDLQQVNEDSGKCLDKSAETMLLEAQGPAEVAASATSSPKTNTILQQQDALKSEIERSGTDAVAAVTPAEYCDTDNL